MVWQGWKNRGSLAWGSLRVEEGNMQYANLQIYRGLFQEAQVFLCPLQVGQGIHSSDCTMLFFWFFVSQVLLLFFFGSEVIMYAMILYSCLQLFPCHFWVIVDGLSTSVELDDFNFGCWTSLTHYFMYWSKSLVWGRAAFCISELFLQIDWEIWFISVPFIYS